MHETIAHAGGNHRKDVRMLEPGRHFALALEPSRQNVAGELGWQDLDHYQSIQREIGGAEETAHAAPLQLLLHSIRIGENRSQALEQSLATSETPGYKALLLVSYAHRLAPSPSSLSEQCNGHRK